MRKIFAPLVAMSLAVLLFSGDAQAQEHPSDTKTASSCGVNTDSNPAQANNPHWSPNEPWKKRWASGAAYFMQGKFLEAEPEVTEALRLAKEAGYTDVLPTVLQMLGLIYMQEGKYNLAVPTLLQAIELEKMKPTPFKGTIYAALIGLGDTYQRDQQYDKALSSLLEAKGMMTPCSPGYPQLMENLAQTYISMEKLQEAEAILGELVGFAERKQSDELSYKYLTNLGEVQLKRKEFDNLAVTLEKAYPYVVKKFGPDSQDAIIFAKNIQHVKDAQHKPVTYEGAAKEWMDLMTSGNKNLDTKQYALAASNFEKALKLAEAEGTQTPPTAVTRAKLALAYSYTGNFNGVEMQLAKALPVLRQYPDMMPAERLAGYEKLYQVAKARCQSSR